MKSVRLGSFEDAILALTIFWVHKMQTTCSGRLNPSADASCGIEDMRGPIVSSVQLSRMPLPKQHLQSLEPGSICGGKLV